MRIVTTKAMSEKLEDIVAAEITELTDGIELSECDIIVCDDSNASELDRVMPLAKSNNIWVLPVRYANKGVLDTNKYDVSQVLVDDVEQLKLLINAVDRFERGKGMIACDTDDMKCLFSVGGYARIAQAVESEEGFMQEVLVAAGQDLISDKAFSMPNKIIANIDIPEKSTLSELDETFDLFECAVGSDIDIKSSINIRDDDVKYMQATVIAAGFQPKR